MKYVVAAMVGLMSVSALASGPAKCQVYKWKEGGALDLTPDSLVYNGYVAKGSYIIVQNGKVKVSSELGSATVANSQIYTASNFSGIMIVSDLSKEVSSMATGEAMLVDHKTGVAVSCK